MRQDAFEADEAAFRTGVLGLLGHLAAEQYRFVTPNRSVHALVRRRREADDATLLRDAFGWVRPFSSGMLPRDLETSLQAAGVIEIKEGRLRSRLRVSSVEEVLFAHSAPDAGDSAVFLGPDSYRYARFLKHALAALPPAATALDIGIGAGVGALTLLSEGLARTVHGSDVNPPALKLAVLNAEHAGLAVTAHLAAGLPETPEQFDLIIANPPFIAGSSGPTYSAGGDLYGAALSLEWARASLDRLTDGGRLVLYTGAPVVDGVDIVRAGLAEMAEQSGFRLSYEEIDPDIFGGSLKRPEYQNVERIAAVGAVLSR